MDLDIVLYFRNQLEILHLNQARHVLRYSSDPFSVPDGLFQGLYRITKDMAHWLLQELMPHMIDGRRVSYIPKAIRIFTGLQFMAQGSYQKAVGQDFVCSMSQSSVSHCLAECTNLITEHLSYLIHFPDTVEEKNLEKERFMHVVNGFPGIIGCIDCTQIKIHAPPRDHPDRLGIIFYCRKGFYSLNVQ